MPPLCLLGARVSVAARTRRWRGKLQPWLGTALIFAAVFTGGYVAWKIGQSYHSRSAALVQFSRRQVRQEAEQHYWRYEVVGGREEGILLYLRRGHFLAPDDAIQRWDARRLDALVVRDEPPRPWLTLLSGAQLRFVPKITDSAAILVPGAPGAFIGRDPPARKNRARHPLFSRYGA